MLSFAQVLFTEAEIKAKVAELGVRVATDFASLSPIIMPILKGGFVVAADLIRAIHPVPEGLEVEFVAASSYGAGTETSGQVSVDFKTEKVKGRHVLLVDDLADSGLTLVEVRSGFIVDISPLDTHVHSCYRVEPVICCPPAYYDRYYR